MQDETAERNIKLKAAMRQVETPLNASGRKAEPQNNRSIWSSKKTDDSQRPWRKMSR